MPPSHINSNNVSVESVHAVTFCGSSGCSLGPPVPACQRGRPVRAQIGMAMRAMKIGRMISGLTVLHKPILIVLAHDKAPSVPHAANLLMMILDKRSKKLGTTNSQTKMSLAFGG